MSKNVVIGLHGHLILALLYRFGALTQPQLVRLTGLHLSNVKRQIGHLTRAGYVAYALDVAGWRRADGPARRGYYLTVPGGAKIAANVLGIENDYLALRHYRRIRLPGTVAHRLLANEYLIRLLEAAGIGAEEVFAESWPFAPIFGSGRPKTDRADSPYRYARIVPDGTFVFSGNRYLLECETGTHARKELASKLSDYAGRWRRMLRPNLGERKFHDPSARPEPVVILTPHEDHKRMRDYLRAALPTADDWAAADEAIRTVTAERDDEDQIRRDKKGRITSRAEAGQLVIVASINEVRADPLARVYRPLFRYPAEISDPAPAEAGGQTGWGVSLSDAAALADRIPIPEKPPKEILEENPLGDEKKKEDVA